MSEAPEWTCRPYRVGDDALLAELFERCFGKPMSVNHWRWKLGSRNNGFDNVWIAADADDRPICQYGGMPRRGRFGGRDLGVMVIVDTMTAPEFRRQGIYTALTAQAHAQWRNAGIDLILGLPNEQHGSRIEAVGWRDVARLRWLVRPLRSDLLLQRRTWLGHAPGVGLASRGLNAYWNRVGPSPDLACDKVSSDAARHAFAALPQTTPSERFTLRRDAEWLEHRLLNGPDAAHRILVAGDESPRGFSAYRLEETEGRRVGAIVELMGDEGPVLDSLVRETAIQLGDEGAEMIIALAIPGSPQDDALRGRGFRHRWGEFTVYAILLDESLDAGALRAAAPWVLSGGDFDVI